MYTPDTQGDRDEFHRHCKEQQKYPSGDLMDAFVVGVRHGRKMQKLESDHDAARVVTPPLCACEVCTVLRKLWGPYL